MCWTPQYPNKHTQKKVDMTYDLLQTTGCNEEPNAFHCFYAEIVMDITAQNSEGKDP